MKNSPIYSAGYLAGRLKATDLWNDECEEQYKVLCAALREAARTAVPVDQDAYERGQRDMREKAAEAVETDAVGEYMADVIRALPLHSSLPADKGVVT